MIQRALNIQYLILQGEINCSQNSKYTERALSFLYDVYSEDRLTKEERTLAGSQSGPKYKSKIIRKNPFEAIFRVDDTFGRLKVLYHSEELTSLTCFTNASFLGKVFGITKRFGVDYNQLTLRLDFLTLLWIRERKLHIVDKIGQKMNKIYQRLFPILSYRYLVEEEVREQQRLGTNFEILTFESETILFQTYVGYMFYLSYLKQEDFNQELFMRCKLFCDWYIMDNQKFQCKLGCVWVYGVHIKQMKQIVKTLENKDKGIAEHLEKYCSKSDSSDDYQVKTEYTDRIYKEFKEIDNIRVLKKMINASFGQEVDLSFLFTEKYDYLI